jgi:hypothetical protein
MISACCNSSGSMNIDNHISASVVHSVTCCLKFMSVDRASFGHCNVHIELSQSGCRGAEYLNFD